MLTNIARHLLVPAVVVSTLTPLVVEGRLKGRKVSRQKNAAEHQFVTPLHEQKDTTIRNIVGCRAI